MAAALIELVYLLTIVIGFFIIVFLLYAILLSLVKLVQGPKFDGSKPWVGSSEGDDYRDWNK